MNVQSDFNIWIIEDRLNEVESYYLKPLEKMAAELDGADAFPPVNVVILGANGVQQRLIKEMRKLAPSRYPRTRPKFHSPDQDYELRPEDFFEFLRQEIGDKDVALIDPTVCGLGWSQPTGVSNYLYYVYNHIEGLKSPEMKDRVLLVSNVDIAASKAKANRINVDLWDKMKEKTIEKFMDEDGAYDRKFGEKLKPFLTPPDEWVNFLNKSGREVHFVEFVERVRESKNSRTVFEAVGTCARWALLHLLFHERHRASDLIAATEGRFYYDPASRDRTSRTPAVLLGDDADSYTVLVRRFVIYGMRAAWDQFCPETTANGYKKQNLDHYKLWLEVTAADYFWYDDEQATVDRILKTLRRPKLTIDSEGRIDIGTIGLGFQGKEARVNYAHIREGRLGIRRDAQRFLRFLDGGISFKYRGETVKNKGEEAKSSARFYYEVRFDGDEDAVPADGAPAKRWEEFWENASAEEFFVKRKNHVDKLQSRLANRCFYVTLDYMLTCHTPMPEEVDWWRKIISEEVGRWLERDGYDPKYVFDPESQSSRRLEARKSS
jgi:hypothetical protein